MYAEKISEAMQNAIEETNRRRTIQENYNKENNITPTTIIKEVREVISNEIDSDKKVSNVYNKKEQERLIKQIEEEMQEAARSLDFERAMELRDILFELKTERS